MKNSPITPIDDNVLIQYMEPDDVSKGGIIIPTGAKEPPVSATVLAVGPGRMLDSGKLVPPPFHVGSKVVLAKVPGRDINLEDIGECKLVKVRDILAVFREDK